MIVLESVGLASGPSRFQSSKKRWREQMCDATMLDGGKDWIQTVCWISTATRRGASEAQERGLDLLKDLIRSHRRWWVLVACVLVTLSAVALLPPPPGVYWTKAEMTFIQPTDTFGNPLRMNSESLVYFAAAVEREFNRQPTKARACSSTATLYGRGIREGFAVSLFSVGNQWQPSSTVRS